MSSYKQAPSKDYKRLTFYLIPYDEFVNRCDDTDNCSAEEFANEGGFAIGFAGREGCSSNLHPKQTIVLSDGDEAQLGVMTNLKGGFCIYFCWL